MQQEGMRAARFQAVAPLSPADSDFLRRRATMTKRANWLETRIDAFLDELEQFELQMTSDGAEVLIRKRISDVARRLGLRSRLPVVTSERRRRASWRVVGRLNSPTSNLPQTANLLAVPAQSLPSAAYGPSLRR
jgi:hypothetical protein